MGLTPHHLPVLKDKIHRLEQDITRLEEAYSINKTSSAATSLRRQLKQVKNELEGFKSLVNVIKRRYGLKD